MIIFKIHIVQLLFISLLTMSRTTYAQKVTYSVVSHSSKSEDSVGVIVDNAFYPLEKSPETPYIFTGSAPIANIGYKYAIVSSNNTQTTESFTRASISKDSYNEVYSISMNTYAIPELPQLYPPLPSIHRTTSNIRKDDQIPSLFFSGAETDINNIHNNFLRKIKINMNLTYIGLNEVQLLKAVELNISGRGTRFSPKASYKIDVGKGNRLFGLRRLKLRSFITDPSYIREKISYDLIKSFGLASTKYSYARVFFNNKPLGLFGLQEDLDEVWLANEFNDADQTNFDQGTLYTGSIHAPLKYLGEMESLYTVKTNVHGDSSYQIEETPRKNGKKLPADFKRLIDFTKFLTKAPSTQPDAVTIWNQQVDIDSVLRSLVLECFLGNTDGYISAGANYNLYTYKNDQLLFIPIDMDMVLGSTFRYNVNTTFYSRFEDRPEFSEKHPLFYAILQVPEFRLKFNGMLKKAFENLSLVYARIDAISGLIQEDVHYDSLIVRDYIPLPSIAVIKKLLKLGSNFGLVKGSDSAKSYASRIVERKISFDVAVNGTINDPSIMGLKQWISMSADSYLKANNISNKNTMSS